MIRLITNIYGILTTAALLLGFVAAIMFVGAIMLGQELGRDWALFAGELMSWGIILAAIAMLAGIIFIYATRSHSLKMERPSNK